MNPLARLTLLYRKCGRMDRALLWLVAVSFALSWLLPAGSPAVLARLILYVAATWGALRLIQAGLRRAIWRLRNRLLVAYLFIAVVPILLVAALMAVILYAYTGQVATYLVTSELERRVGTLRGMAQYLVKTEPGERTDWIRRTAPYLRERFGGLELQIRGRTNWTYPENSTTGAPPKGWGEASGLLLKDQLLYVWAHVVHQDAEVSVLAPLTHDFLGDLVPNLGEVSVVALDEAASASRRLRIPRSTGAETAGRSANNRLPDPYNRFDREVRWGALVPMHIWDAPGKAENELLRLRTRPSAVLGAIFAQKLQMTEGAIAALVILIASLFLIAEFISLLIGVTISRTITGAVHGLYDGTQRVREGEFSHRIQVQGNDQLAELGHSFNRMTENIERLLEISKEKERLQSELEIAREVQNQLFPKAAPALESFRLAAYCNPARMVSGDYYDYQSLDDNRIALAVGDVAGKGISAALLMATVQATLRTQIRSCLEAAVAVGNGKTHVSVSTSRLVSQLNQQLHAHTSPEKFATFYFAIYDDMTSVLTYTNAGHLPPILVRGGQATRLDVNGMVVGAFPFATYEESRLELQPGDLLACFTDGITEPENEYGEMFGEERLMELIVRNAGRDFEEIVGVVMQSVAQWTGSPAELQDDMTLLLARRQ